ncbi:TPA: hypothetical protein U5E37_002697 [Yersinia enterocolitica]|uniref:hypothetical protein n=1 Tax=Yersinia enterocolitica TaxID=630 RepID=UPI002AC40FA6|nr:hypothetical protein [Yersinia enterocolitica]HEN3571868.1 hypothetical protein [Yersinia enterocolitica]HEN3575849.1 hypothetical protein [Yersinia enterocolitica]HEN3605204.1 hypothetical protein [Yersinia enterocolitica]HEN3650518.1 hypothetical protein [Yersinia enterocolitica]
MDWLTFFSIIFQTLGGLIGTLVWPGLILLILFYGKSDIIDLLRSLKSLKFNGNEVTFERESKQAAITAERAIPFNEIDNDTKQTLLSYPPRLAIIESWLIVERAVGQFIERKTGEVITPKDAYKVRKILRDLKVLNQDQMSVYALLNNMRNESAHLYELKYSSSAIENYVNSALALAQFFDSLDVDEENN